MSTREQHPLAPEDYDHEDDDWAEEVWAFAEIIEPRAFNEALESDAFAPIRNQAIEKAQACLNFIADRALTHLPTPPGRWVPLEPTEADMERMWTAYASDVGRYLDEHPGRVPPRSARLDAMRAAYRAMLEAAPAGGG